MTAPRPLPTTSAPSRAATVRAAPSRAATARAAGPEVAGAPARRPERRAVPGVAPARRPNLVVVPDPRARRAQRLARLATLAAVVLAGAGMFAAVGLHVLLAEGQTEVARLERRLEAAQERSLDLRVEMARRESPEVVVGEARRRLGMAAASKVTPLEPVPYRPAPGTGGADPVDGAGTSLASPRSAGGPVSRSAP